jgi:hypothetical protein
VGAAGEAAGKAARMEEDNMAEKRTRISLRFWHPSWKATVFSETLGLTPRFAWTVGTPRATPTGIALDGLYTESYWCHQCETDIDNDPDTLITRLVEEISSQANFLRSVSETGGKAEILVWIISPNDFGESFSNETLLRLGTLGINLSFDIYFGDPEES